MPEILCPCSGFLSAKDPITWKEKNTPSATKQAWSQLHRWNIGYSEKKKPTKHRMELFWK